MADYPLQSQVSLSMKAARTTRPDIRAGAGLRPGAAIVNARGTPGTLGAFAVTRHGRTLVLLSSHHVLFGGGAASGEPVWLGSAMTGRQRVATTLYGKLGVLRCGDGECYVDCAVAAIDNAQLIGAETGSLVNMATDSQRGVVGDRVTKMGPVTGWTDGVILADAYDDTAIIDCRRSPAPRQLVIRSTSEQTPFSVGGESGAIVLDGDGRAVGLVWGTTARGDAVACPIGPVLDVLGIDLVDGHDRA